MVPPALLSFLHFIDYGANLFFLGFLFYFVMIRKDNPKKKWLLLGFGAALSTSIAWMLVTALDMADGWDLKAIAYAMTKTDFAHWWCVRLVILLFGFIFAYFQKGLTGPRFLFLILLLATPLFSSLTSHAGTSESYRGLRIGLDYFHFVSASIWGGGLFGIFLFLDQIKKAKNAQSFEVFETVKRFSHFAMFSTGILMATGLVQVYLIENSLSRLWASDYGKLIFLKLFLFCSALLAAAVNQFYHMSKYKAGNDFKFAISVRREVGLEISIIFLVLGVTSVLTRSNLPGM